MSKTCLCFFFSEEDRHSSKELFCSITSPFSWISMEGFASVKPKRNSESEPIDLSLKLSPCGQHAEVEEDMVLTGASSSSMVWEKAENSMMGNWVEEGPFVLCVTEGDKGFVRFGDLQKMRRLRTGKRLLMKKMLMADKSLLVPRLLPQSIHSILKPFPNPSGDSWHQGGSYKEDESMVCSKALQEMTPWGFGSKIERPAKKLKHVNSNHKSDAMDMVRQIPGNGTSGKRIGRCFVQV